MNMKRSLLFCATSLQKAFPHFHELSLGDLTFGLGLVADKHIKENRVDKINIKYPKLEEENKYNDHTSKYNPDCFSMSKLKMMKEIAETSHSVYHPDTFVNSSKVTKFRKESDHLLPGYFIKYDHELKRIIIAVKGTSTVSDILTDITCDSIRVNYHKQYSDKPKDEYIEGWVHRGIYLSAYNLFQHIIIALEQALRMYPKYSILTCGHSLGGGTAVCLGLLIREWCMDIQQGRFEKSYQRRLEEYNSDTSRWAVNEHINPLTKEEKIKKESEDTWLDHVKPREARDLTCDTINMIQRDFFKRNQGRLPIIQCATFASACTFNLELSQWCKPWVTSFVLGSDIVPRFSIGQANALKKEIEDSKWHDELSSYYNESVKDKRIQPYIEKLNDRLSSWSMPTIPTSINVKDFYQVSSIEKASTPDFNPEDYPTLFPVGDMYLITYPTHDEEDEQVDDPFKRNAELEQPDEYAPVLTKEDQKKDDDFFASLYDIEPVKKALENLTDLDMPKIKIITDYANKPYTIRHVRADHFDTIIFSKNMFTDHRLRNFLEAFKFLTSIEKAKPDHDYVSARMDAVDKQKKKKIN